MKNSIEFKNILKQFLLVAIIGTIVTVMFAIGNTMIYQKNLLNQQAILIDAIIKEHPELEEDIVNLIKEEKGNQKEGQALLKQYGITIDSFRQLEKQKSLNQQVILYHLITFAVVLIGVVLVYLFSLKKFYQKLHKMNCYMNDVLNDKHTFKINEFEEGTFSTLQNDVYKITNKLKEQNENISRDKKYLEETLSDISHQLKTPLTSMYMMNNLLKDDHLDTKLKKEFLHKNELQLERIEWLVSSLLKLSRLESGMIQLKREEVKIVDLLKDALEPLKIPIEVKNQKISYKGNLKTTVICDFNWTKEALVNIIKNAHEHTKEEGSISFTWQDNPLYVMITISDNGEGIAKEDLPHVFERFYKGKQSNKESIGIGLNMASQIINRQQGDITVQSEKGKGTTFIIKFYKNII